jgi:outer membrane receptor protein involved in Fe transport
VLRTTLGLRGDLYGYDVTAIDPRNSGDGSDGIVSPKLTAVLGPWQDTEFYVNWGHGFHSNDARGATLTVDPRTGLPVETLTPLVTARGAEVGMRTVRIRGLQSTVALWYLGFDSELLFIGDSGITEANRPSRRYGLEWANYMRFNSWMTGEVDMSFTNARFTDPDPAGSYIPGALNRVVAGAVTVEPARRIFGSIRVRHFGPRALVEDNSVQSESTTIWNAEMGITLSEQLRISVEAFNLFDSDVADIDYYYASRLPGEPIDGVDDIHTHPSIPRTARVSLQVAF